MKQRLLNPKVQEALEYFENRRKKKEELRQRLDFLGISKIEKNSFAKQRYDFKRKNEAKLWIIQQLGGKCSNPKCNYDGIALTIHHIHGRSDIKISRRKEYLLWFRDKQIPPDVEVLCFNCHMERHGKHAKQP